MNIQKYILVILLSLLSACASLEPNPEDLALQREVEQAILSATNAPSLLTIQVSVYQGVVRLIGRVESGYDRWAAYSAARQVPGDFKLVNLIHVE